jgi:hypothetical protein
MVPEEGGVELAYFQTALTDTGPRSGKKPPSDTATENLFQLETLMDNA